MDFNTSIEYYFIKLFNNEQPNEFHHALPTWKQT